MRVGFKLFAEAYSPIEVVRQAVRAEEAGFDFVEISDHFHPWLHDQNHSGFAWSILGSIAAKTSILELATGVTCPFVRYHPAIVAQAAATTALLSDGRFVLGLGSGERLNEHVVARGWPSASTRSAMLRESIEIIRLLWSGGYRSYRGRHLELEDARVFDLPERLPPIIVAGSGGPAAKIAAEMGDGLFATEADRDLIAQYEKAGGSGRGTPRSRCRGRQRRKPPCSPLTSCFGSRPRGGRFRPSCRTRSISRLPRPSSANPT